MIRNKNHISRQQTLLSVIILSILTVIGAAIVISQTRFNPAILIKDELRQAPDLDRPVSAPPVFEAFVPLPQGLSPFTAPEIFESEKLSDKINGKAELYLSAGFARLVSQRFRHDDASDVWVEAYVYDMTNGQNAFAVFSSQRREDAESLNLTQYAYRSPNAIFLVHGRYYIELIASEASDRVRSPLLMLATTFIRNTPAETIQMTEQDLFPPQDLVAGSITLISADAFGYERLDQVYTAEYRLNDESLMAYLSRRQTPGQAEELAAAYGQFLLNFGGRTIEQQLPFKNALFFEIMDTYEIIFSCGPFVAGVREATTRDQAVKLAIQLFNKVKEATGES
jgi:hypothetical protein